MSLDDASCLTRKSQAQVPVQWAANLTTSTVAACSVPDCSDNQSIMQQTLKDLVSVLRDPELPYGEWNAQASALHARMPAKLDQALSEIVDRAHQRHIEFPAKQLAKAFEGDSCSASREGGDTTRGHREARNTDI